MAILIPQYTLFHSDSPLPVHKELIGVCKMTIHAGHDFPPDVRSKLNSWKSGIIWIETPQRETTRGLNVCHPHGRRGKYLLLLRNIATDELSKQTLNI